MTVEVEVKCDGDGCWHHFRLDDHDNVDAEIRSSKWHTDPDNGYFHYCPKCWNKIEKEMEGQEP